MNPPRGLHARIALIMVLTLAGGGMPGLSRPEGPAIHCDAPVFDYGERPDTGELEHVFIITNRGSAPLLITQVRSGCGCTRAVMDRNTLPPGATARLSTRLTLKGYSGLKNATIYLHSNDPATPVFLCKYTGNVIAEMELAPAAFTFDITPESSNQTASVTLRNRTSLPLTPLSLDFPAGLTAVDIATNEPGRRYTLTAHCPAGAGSLRATVTLITDHPRYETISIPLVMTAVRDLNAFPAELILKESAPDAIPESHYIILMARGGRTFTARNIEVVPPVIPVAIHSLKPSWVRLKVGPMRVTKGMDGTVIRLHTDLPLQPVVEIPVRVTAATSTG
jgi:hypothetical protein